MTMMTTELLFAVMFCQIGLNDDGDDDDYGRDFYFFQSMQVET